MIKKVQCIAYTCICDGCGANLLEDAEYGGISDDMISEEMDLSDWEEIEDKHYCQNCYEENADGFGQWGESNWTGKPRFSSENCTGDYWQNFPTNPQFSLEMMGFPTNWTVLPFQSGKEKQ